MTAMHRRFRTHGMSGTKAYRAFGDIKQRCLNPLHPDYQNYGARGISIAPEWVNDFAAFIAHVGLPPTPQHSIERVDNNGNYEPGNVRWATLAEQRRNTRRDRTITHNGRTMHLVDWAREIGICPPALHKRLKRWPIERALTQSPR